MKGLVARPMFDLELFVFAFVFAVTCAEGRLHGDLSDSGFLSPTTPRSSARVPTLASPPLDGILRSLFRDEAPAQEVTEEIDSSKFPDNIHRTFSYLPPQPPPSIDTPRYEALTRNESSPSYVSTRYYNTDLNRQRPVYVKTDDNRDPQKIINEIQSSKETGPHVSPQDLHNHWSTKSNVIREEDQDGLYKFSYATPSHTSEGTIGTRGNVRGSWRTTPVTNFANFGSESGVIRRGKTIPEQRFPTDGGDANVHSVISPTTYRTPSDSTGDKPYGYSFSINNENHSREETGDVSGNFRGRIKYVDTFGRSKEIDYQGNAEKGLVSSETTPYMVSSRSGFGYLAPVSGYSYSTVSPVQQGTSAIPQATYNRGAKKFQVPGYYEADSSTQSPLAQPDGSYAFRFDAGDHERQETRDGEGNVRGMYSYDGPDGQRKTVNYEANAAKGFVAQGSHIPFQSDALAASGASPGDGSYFFAYNAGDHSREELRDGLGNVHGTYSLVSGDGDTKRVHYVASKDGFVARGAHVPERGAYSFQYNVGDQKETDRRPGHLQYDYSR